jgi:hypothetical protein
MTDSAAHKPEAGRRVNIRALTPMLNATTKVLSSFFFGS